nr:hypothetical protein CFP56_67010 [Quercus suber]
MSGIEGGGMELKNETMNESQSARKPLGEITPNSGGNKSEEEPSMIAGRYEQYQPQQKTPASSDKIGINGTKKSDTASATANSASPSEITQDAPQTVAYDGVQAELLNSTMSTQEEKFEHIQTRDNTSKSLPNVLGRSTRSRTAKQADAQSPSDGRTTSLVEQESYFQHLLEAPTQESGTEFSDIEKLNSLEKPAEPTGLSVLDAPASPLPSAMPNVISKLRDDAVGQRSTSNKENMEPTETSPPTSPSFPVESHGIDQVELPVQDTSPNTEEVSRTPASRPTYDALETAAVKAATPSSTPRRTSTLSASNAIDAMDALEDAVDKVNAELPDASVISQGLKTKKKEAPVVRMTKGAQARISLAHGAAKTTPSWGPPRQSTLARSQGVKDAASSAKLSGSTSSDKSDVGGSREKKEVVIPHSKPRPMSVSFPPPKPLAKSSKPPTKSTFQLPGEVVAAKLKAAREERAEKETVMKRTFKARPAPVPSKVAPVVRETNSSKFRQSLMNPKTVQPIGHRRANSVAPPQPHPVAKVTPATSTSNRLDSSHLKVNKRPSTAMGNVGMARTPSRSSEMASSTAQRVPVKGTSKGKEVFNRAAAAKEALEKEKREKEEATKKARAAAAERSRQASREWAKKQEMKKTGAKGTVTATPEAQAA